MGVVEQEFNTTTAMPEQPKTSAAAMVRAGLMRTDL